MDYDMLRKDIDDALAKIGEKYNIDAKIGAIRYDASGFRTTIEATIKTVNGKSGAQVEYELYARKFGIDASTFGKIFTSNGEKYEIVGIDRNARKYPVLGKNTVTGQMMKFTAMRANMVDSITHLVPLLPDYRER
jgi:hypothetical protein